jgi:glycosyltransferase involved in cell wall biosynthesis
VIRGVVYRARWIGPRTWRLARGPGRHFGSAAPGRRWVIFTENFNATYFISFEIPLRHLQQRERLSFSAYSQQDVEESTAREWKGWILAQRPEAVIFTRYGRPDGPEIMAFCQAHGIPVVYHIDDDLLELPQTLGDDILQRNAVTAVVDARRDMLATCDLVYASTPQLAETLRRRLGERSIFHGIYAPCLPVTQGDRVAPSADVIGYMGSRGHRHDLALVVPALVRLMRERPALRFETFGTIEMPAPLQEFRGRVRHHQVNTSYRGFLRKLASLGWGVGIAPLEDTPFNRCKAPTKFIEYTSCGIPTAASDMPVYAATMPPGGGRLVGTDWHAALSELLDDRQGTRSRLRVAREHCATEFSLDRLAAQLLHVLDRARSFPTGPQA